MQDGGHTLWRDRERFSRSTLLKQIGSFNLTGCRPDREMVVTRGLFQVLETNCIKQPERQLPSSSQNYNTLTILRKCVRVSPAYKSVEVRYCNICKTLSQMSDVMRVVSVFCLQDELGSYLSGCLMQLAFHTALSLQLVCNPDNHSVVQAMNLQSRVQVDLHLRRYCSKYPNHYYYGLVPR